MIPSSDISVVTISKGRWEHLAKTLPLWKLQTQPHKEVIVVDYGCPDGTAEHVRQEHPWCRVIEAKPTSPYFKIGHARNLGAVAAVGSWLAFADARMLPPPDYLERMAAIASETVNLVFLSQSYEGGFPWHNGACLVSRDIYLRVRGFDERADWWGHDDTDFYERCKLAGAKTGYVYNVAWLGVSEEERFRYRCVDNREASLKLAEEAYANKTRVVNPNGFGLLEG